MNSSSSNESNGSVLIDSDGLDWDELAGGIGRFARIDSLQAWFEAAAAFPLLDKPQEIALARAIEAGLQAATELSRNPTVDPPLRHRLEQIVQRGLRLVASIAKRYRGVQAKAAFTTANLQGLDFLDLLQEGVLGPDEGR